MSGPIPSCDVVATCGFGSHNCVTKLNKQVKAKLRILGIKVGKEGKIR